MTNKKPHPHAELIIELVKDISKAPEILADQWRATNIEAILEDYDGRYKFRIKPAEPPKPKIVSSLSEKEIFAFFDPFAKPYKEDARELADAAAQRAIDDLHPPPRSWIEGLYDDPVYRYVVSQAIADYVTAVKEGKV